jgi:hypothetical protein
VTVICKHTHAHFTHSYQAPDTHMNTEWKHKHIPSKHVISYRWAHMHTPLYTCWHVAIKRQSQLRIQVGYTAKHVFLPHLYKATTQLTLITPSFPGAVR